MAPLRFDQNPILDGSVNASRALLGWRFGAVAMVVVNAGSATASLGAHPSCVCVCVCVCVCCTLLYYTEFNT